MVAIGFDIGLSTGGYESSEILPCGPPTGLAVSAKISPLSTPLWITLERGKQTRPNLSLVAEECNPFDPNAHSLPGDAAAAKPGPPPTSGPAAQRSPFPDPPAYPGGLYTQGHCVNEPDCNDQYTLPLIDRHLPQITEPPDGCTPASKTDANAQSFHCSADK